jgi:uncharacterized protein (TIGR03792 family)
MVIEYLTYQVAEADQPRFIRDDAAIWTAALSTQPGYLGKEIWRDVTRPDHLCLVIRWDSREAWHAVPRALLDATNARFQATFGTGATLHGCTDLDVMAG